MMRGAVTALVVLGAIGRAAAVEITACGQFVPSGETAVLAADLHCAATPDFPFSAHGVQLDGGATLELAGHAITGDGGGVGVECSPQQTPIRSRRYPCRVHGPGTVSGFELGIGYVGVVEVRGVTVRDNEFGISVAKCCRLDVTDVVASDNAVAGVSAIRLFGSGLRADRNGLVGVSSFRFRVEGLMASGNGAGGGVYGRGRLTDSVVVGNAGFDGSYDLLAFSRIRTRDSSCGKGIRLRTRIDGANETTTVLGRFACR